MIEFRKHRGDKFYDVGFHQAQADPIGTVRKFYAWLGEPCTPEYERRMEAWIKAHPKGKHGEYQVDPAEYGLSVDGLRKQYAFYMEQYKPLISPA
jgi:hypothetical protein